MGVLVDPELPSAAAASPGLHVTDALQSYWVSSRPAVPRPPRLRIAEDIRREPEKWVGRCSSIASLGTLIDGAMAFAIDDALAGVCKRIEIRIGVDGSAVVSHDGPGFDPRRASQGLQRWPWPQRTPDGEIVLTQARGAPVVTCALSHWCHLEVRRGDGVWRQAFYRGRPECPLRRVSSLGRNSTGTELRFRPDRTIFSGLAFELDDLYMRGLGYMLDLPLADLHLSDERTRAPTLVITGGSHLLG